MLVLLAHKKIYICSKRCNESWFTKFKSFQYLLFVSLNFSFLLTSKGIKNMNLSEKFYAYFQIPSKIFILHWEQIHTFLNCSILLNFSILKLKNYVFLKHFCFEIFLFPYNVYFYEYLFSKFEESHYSLLKDSSLFHVISGFYYFCMYASSYNRYLYIDYIYNMEIKVKKKMIITTKVYVQKFDETVTRSIYMDYSVNSCQNTLYLRLQNSHRIKDFF